MASTGEMRLRRHLACAVAVLTAGSFAFQYLHVESWADRDIAERAARYLLSGHLDVYAHVPDAQMGPLALLLAGVLPTTLYAVVISSALYPLIYLALVTYKVTPSTLHIMAAMFVGTAWCRFAITAHADDAVVLTGAVLICFAQRRDLSWLAAAGFVLALAGKPTAVLLLPLVWLVSKRAAAWSVACAAVVWLPFALADLRGFLDAGGGIVPVFPYSLPALLGAETGSPYPWWVRPVQLVAGLAVCWVVGRRVGFAAALAATLSTRAFLEPGTYPLYWQSIVVAAFLVDLSGRWRVPWATVAALGGWMVTWGYALTPVLGGARLLLLVAVALLSVASGHRVERGGRDVRGVLGGQPSVRQEPVA